ncbi:MAG: DinB family protein [Alphaproteobacteria bacterium]|nr:DinB family protein [Alphaproteobacteria bacterium]MBL6940276.1 DinB family protein [Alphaproteobacteria bacterium]MBL7099719.1 DinB family protein [Alphaproteobacteria bacterium]
MSNAFLISLFGHKAWCNTELLSALRAAPKDLDRLSWATILLTFDHITIVDRIFRARLESAEVEDIAVVARAVPTLDDLAARVSETDNWYLRYAAQISEPELNEVITFTYVSDGDEGRMSRGDILAHVITHGASHRGAIGKMFETLGVAGAPDMVTTFRRLHPHPKSR